MYKLSHARIFSVSSHIGRYACVCALVVITGLWQTTNFRACFFYNTFLYCYSLILLFCIDKFFQVGERKQQNNQP